MASSESFSSTQGPPIPRWQLEYESTLQETDRNALFKRIEIAEAAILTRREALEQTPDGLEERRELEKALTTVLLVKKEILQFSPFEGHEPA